ncbi:Na+/H+ antiporter NhaC family protein [Sulfurimonas sp. C5]|uniref:Na+/H+ antiporter NhaC family protein n=1 Tax=Sulfurimonas sp. C5 TaxID=3036947 RepID=UPI002457B6CC|nr:Na+/H+ antiporter NhaC family protein [Sulfurimonas sp. C5]MDH4945257.1 Na+/H+ antiporter NhaC family protein [Sulfurimonas sp. C5]
MMLLSKGWILKTLAFAILVGSIMEILERSGAIESFVKYMTLKRSIVKSPRSALVITYMIGVLIFIESSITSLIAGAVGKPLCDREGVSRAKLAYVCDSTSAPICSLLLFNGWGALLLGLIITQVESGIIHGNSVEFLIDAVVFNFYSMSALAVTFAVIFFGLYTKGMQNSTVHEYKLKNNDLKNANIWQMLVPILFLVLSIFAFLFITGNGDILKGSGSSSIFYTTLTTMVFMFIFYVLFGRMRAREYMIASVKGANKLFPIAMILLFAFAIGEVTSELKTGLYLASFASENINVSFLAAVIFVLSGIIAFSTGTSWGTFSIMIPIAVPMAVALDANIPLIIGAVISGGVFGDHCSPISDTTIISSLASGCDVVEHVNTQLPYALLSALIAIVFFIIASL